MLTQLAKAALAGGIQISHVYLGHIKKDEDRKVLAHAEACLWEEVEPAVRGVLDSHLYQAMDGEEDQVNFRAFYTGEVLSIGKVTSSETDLTRNQPVVELLEGIRDMGPVMGSAFNPQLVEFGNILAFKVMAAGAIKNHLVAILKATAMTDLDAEPIPFVFATVVDLDDREEALFDEMKGRFVTQEIHNAIKRSKVSRAVFFPCLDEEGKETADLLVYAGSGAGAWFKALEATRRFSPQAEGKALLKMIAEQTDGEEITPDLFARMTELLQDDAENGLLAEHVATALEKVMGHGIDRLGFAARWESAFGDLGYRPAYESLFSFSVKMVAGGITVTLSPIALSDFRQVAVDGKTYLAFEAPESAKVGITTNLRLHVRQSTPTELAEWMAGQAG